MPPSSSISATKFANSGELFAWFDLKDEISEDTKFGRLVLESVKSVQVTFENSEKVRKRVSGCCGDNYDS